MRSKNSALRSFLKLLCVFAAGTALIVMIVWFFDYSLNGVVLDWLDRTCTYSYYTANGVEVKQLDGRAIKRLAVQLMIINLAFWLIVGFVVMQVRRRRLLREAGTQVGEYMLGDMPAKELPNELAAPLSEAKSALVRSESLLREETARKNDLVMYLAHDLKTPLASVIGYLTLLRDERELSPELREKYLSITLDKAERLEELINEFFEITRFNLSTVTLERGRIDLVRLLEQLRYEFMPMLRDKRFTCKLTAPETLPVYCDAGKIQRVFDNLLRNAVLYGYPDTEIMIDARLDGANAVVSVKNSGATIPEEKLRRIFEQFFRLDAARSTDSGAGLGLAIADQIVRLHGGTINARSADETIEFTVTLPVGKS